MKEAAAPVTAPDGLMPRAILYSSRARLGATAAALFTTVEVSGGSLPHPFTASLSNSVQPAPCSRAFSFFL